MSDSAYCAALHAMAMNHRQCPRNNAYMACQESHEAYVRLDAAQRAALKTLYTEPVGVCPSASLVINADNTDEEAYRFKEHIRLRIVRSACKHLLQDPVCSDTWLALVVARATRHA